MTTGIDNDWLIAGPLWQYTRQCCRGVLLKIDGDSAKTNCEMLVKLAEISSLYTVAWSAGRLVELALMGNCV